MRIHYYFRVLGRHGLWPRVLRMTSAEPESIQGVAFLIKNRYSSLDGFPPGPRTSLTAAGRKKKGLAVFRRSAHDHIQPCPRFASAPCTLPHFPFSRIYSLIPAHLVPNPVALQLRASNLRWKRLETSSWAHLRASKSTATTRLPSKKYFGHISGPTLPALRVF